MNFSKLSLASIAFGSVSAGFSASTQTNLAVYWGQNSVGQSASQGRLAAYCANTQINIIPLAFLNGITNPVTNFASAGSSCSVFSGTQLLNCPQIEEDIKTCQQTYGKTILVSIGGATYTEGGFASASAAQAAATNVWNLFGPNTANARRPFGSAVVDGFDLDFESANTNMVPFAQQLRQLMDASTTKKYYLSAAPQCPYPDVATNEMLNGAVAFDFIMVQFYNNYCGVQSFVPGSASQYTFNFQTWDTWAKVTSKNKNVKVFLGVPATTSAGAGYQPASALAPIIAYCKQFSSFGGVMMWDMSQLWTNPGYLNAVHAALVSGGSAPVPPTTTSAVPTTSTQSTSRTTTTFITSSRPVVSTSSSTTTTTTTTTTTRPTTTTSSRSTTTSLTTTTTSSSTLSTVVATPTPPGGNPATAVRQWGQCGGQGYTGSTQCEAPFHCIVYSIWWSHCN